MVISNTYYTILYYGNQFRLTQSGNTSLYPYKADSGPGECHLCDHYGVDKLSYTVIVEKDLYIINRTTNCQLIPQNFNYFTRTTYAMNQVQSLFLNPLKPYLLPITTNLPTPLADSLTSLLGRQCYDVIFHNLDITRHPECASLAISKALGIAIVAAAAFVKVPQILKLVRAQSAASVSFGSYALETVSFLITLAYNVRSGWPFGTYGETALILVQDVVISALVLHFTGRDQIAGAFVAGVLAVGYALLGPQELVNIKTMGYLQAVAGVLGIASKVPQILTNYDQGSTGQLSAFAVFNYLLGSLMRIFTTMREVDDRTILYGFVAGFALNAVLAGQMVYYWNAHGTAGHGGEISEKVPPAVGQSSAVDRGDVARKRA